MDSTIRRAVAQDALQTVLCDLDTQASDTSPVSPRQWEVPLPPPYGPGRRLVLRLEPLERSDSCSLRADVSGASQSQGVFLSQAELREALGGTEALARLEKFLDWALEDVDLLLEASQPFDLPLVAVDRNGAPYAVLDHRDVGMERWGPGDLNCAWWRLLLRHQGAWRDAGVASSQAAGTRSGLHARVRKALGVFDGLAVGEFTFRLWHPSPAEFGEPVRGDHGLQFRLDPAQAHEGVDVSALDARDPAIARLREFCHTVINASPEDMRQDAIHALAHLAHAREAGTPASRTGRRGGVLDALRSALRIVTGRGSR